MMHDEDSDERSALTFTYDPKELVKVLKQNRRKHQQDYNRAVKGYFRELRKQVTEVKKAFAKNAAALAKKITAKDTGATIGELYSSMSFSGEAPKSYLHFYDEAITMFEMTADEVIDLPRKEFQQLVMDRWEWKDKFVGSVSRYTRH